ncbi:MAG: class I SAM-dependent methyltransferase [Tepidiformaceae bacterium]
MLKRAGLVRRTKGLDPERHSLLRAGNLLMVQERDRYIAGVLRTHGIESLQGVAAFEAGCSGGYNLRQLVQLGARPENLAGMDIDGAAVAHCRERAPQIRVHEGSAEAVPEADAAFDLALAFTLFSSVRDEDAAAGIASELFRVTRPGGLIIVYDMRRRSPRNPNVHPIALEDLRRWFPKCPARARSITLAPPLARALGKYAPWLYAPLAAVPPLRTHAVWVLRRPALPPTFGFVTS